ncbi:MAG: type II toxin-antitoxin system HicB family antitoxin [Candidatus Omnitrophica bacterium]|nr:type II toxin-antitoxin system HicB family antitoxin [Candidatus Omnitrophota bacterium]
MEFQVKIPVQFLKEGNQVVAVCPVLDVSAYGDSLEEAKVNFEHALDAFVDETTKNHTLDQALKEHGWQEVQQASGPRWSPPQVIESHYEEITLPI